MAKVTAVFFATPPTAPDRPHLLWWWTTGARSVSINNGVGTVAANGSLVIAPTVTTTYTLTAKGQGPAVTVKTTVTITAPSVVVPPVPPPVPAPTATLAATPSTVTKAGTLVTVSWATTNTTKVTLDGALVAASGSKVVTPTATKTYTLVATGAGGTVTKETIVSFAMIPVVVPPSSDLFDGPAELPRVYIDTTYTEGGETQIIVSGIITLQSALNTAAANSGKYLILLAPGSSHTLNYILPLKADANWVTIRTNISYASLPAQGTRMTPTLAASLNLAKVQTPNTAPVFVTAGGAVARYRFLGLEVTSTATVGGNLFELGDSYQTSLTNVAHDFIIDRCYLHGVEGRTIKRGIYASAASVSLVDSWGSSFLYAGSDSQVFSCTNGPGPYKIVGNYLSAGAECVLFGGGDPTVPNLIPSDIEIRRNYWHKDLAWKTGPNDIKNLYENKNGQRILIEGNVFDGSYEYAGSGSGQVGMAMNLQSRNQHDDDINDPDGAPWCMTGDLTIRYNIFTNCPVGLSLAAVGKPIAVSMRRVSIHDNVMDLINAGSDWVVVPGGTNPYFIFIYGTGGYGTGYDLSIKHNTMVTTGSLSYGLYFSDYPTNLTTFTNFTFTDNIMTAYYAVKSDGGIANGSAGLTHYTTGTVAFTNNALIWAPSTDYTGHPGNFFPATEATMLFVNYGARNYTLQSSSIGYRTGLDGADLGANIATVATKTAGVAP